MNAKKIALLIFWIATVIYFECIAKMVLFGNIIDSDFIQMLVFCLPVACLIYVISTLFSEKINKIVNIVILSLLFFIFFSQMIYFKVYSGVFSIYSMTNGGQVLEFWRTILSTVVTNAYSFIMLTLPLAVYFGLKKRFFDFSKNDIIITGISVASLVLLACTTFLFLNINKVAIYSSYNLYFNTQAPILSTKKFGLLTTMGIDLKRCIFGMTEKKIEITIDNQVSNSGSEKEYYNNLDIDFENLIANETDETTISMHRYFESLSGTKKNEYTGLFKGKNVVFFLAESLDPIAIDPILTPTLYKLANNGFNFTNYYTPLYPASTADGEFRTEWSLISSRGDTLTLYAAKDVYSPYIFVNSFSDYNINVYHNYNGDYYGRRVYFKSLGYKNFKSCYYGLNMDCGSSFHESDLDMVNVTADEYINSNNPFFTYYITLSGHLSYIKSTNKIAQKNWSLVENLPYSSKVKGYLASNIELDKAIESLIEKLEVAGKLDDTVIVITPDHYPYGLKDNLEEVSDIVGVDRTDPFEIYHSDLIIWNNAMDKTIKVDKVGSNPDVLPTLLNLFGIDYDSRFITGQDLLADSEGLVVLANRSWITDKGRYNSVADEALGNGGLSLDEKYVSRINTVVDNQFKISNLILENNYYEKVFKQDE